MGVVTDADIFHVIDRLNVPVAERYACLLGSAIDGNKRLHSVQEVAEFICKHGQYGDVRITTIEGKELLDTFGIYINKISDMEYREELLKVLVPMQHAPYEDDLDVIPSSCACSFCHWHTTERTGMNSFMSWVGGKKSLRDAVLARFPPYYERYIEVFGGAGWVLFHKPPGNDFECYNDFNSNLVNLYRCVRDNPNKLKYKLRYVLDFRQDFEWIASLHKRGLFPRFRDYDRAAKFYQLVRYSYASGLDSFGSQPHSIWSDFPMIDMAARRLQKVVIENKDFEKLIRQYDRPVSFGLFVLTGVDNIKELLVPENGLIALNKKAIIALCRILLTAIWNVLSKCEPYSAKGYLADKLTVHSVVISKAEGLALLRQRGYILKDEVVDFS